MGVGKVGVLLKTGVIPTVFERLSANKRTIKFIMRTSSKKEKNSSGKAREIRAQTHITVNCT